MSSFGMASTYNTDNHAYSYRVYIYIGLFLSWEDLNIIFDNVGRAFGLVV